MMIQAIAKLTRSPSKIKKKMTKIKSTQIKKLMITLTHRIRKLSSQKITLQKRKKLKIKLTSKKFNFQKDYK